MRQALGDDAGAAQSAQNLELLQQLAPAPVEESTLPSTEQIKSQEEPVEPTPEDEEVTEPEPISTPRRSGAKIGIALLTALALVAIGAFALWYAEGLGPGEEQKPDFAVSWEFGDAWNALDGETWTQQIRIVVEGANGDFDYFLDGKPTDELFQVVLPICKGSQGTVQVKAGDGQSAEVAFEFDSPYCR
jgi:hypothetical protein